MHSKEDLESLMTVLKTPLPSCFRVNPTSIEADRLRASLKEVYQFSDATYNYKDMKVTPPR